MTAVQIIRAAIESERQSVVNRALRRAEAHVEAVIAAIEAAGWDMNVAYPYPHGRMSRAEYVRAKDSRMFAESITRSLPGRCRGFHDPHIVARSEPLIQSYLDSVRVAVDVSFDDYASKLAAKIGDGIAAAKLVTGPLWQSSILSVTRPDGSVERWKTQMILNVSCLGRLFNQWPTRKLAA